MTSDSHSARSGGIGPAMSRRDVMRMLGYGVTFGGLAGIAGGCSEDAAVAPETLGDLSSAPRVLVVIELAGGNDGWSTLVPIESGVLRDLRPTIAHSADEVVDWGDGVGLNSHLASLAKRNLAVVEGIGSFDVDLSHFEMFARWHRGRIGAPPVSGTASEDDPTGVLGRICDSVGAPGTLTGLSLGWGDHPSMIAARTATSGLVITSADALSKPEAADRHRRLVRELAGSEVVESADPMGRAHQSLGLLADLISLTLRLPPPPVTLPPTDLGNQLAFASRLIAANVGIRVIHVPMGAATFDTHSKHRAAHDPLMVDLGAALDGFLEGLDSMGVSDRVLVATSSEFGRRPRQNGDGLDHGGASVALMAGPVVAGRHGEPSPLDKFDRFDNLLATVGFDRYLATLAAFLDVDPDAVLPSSNGRAVEPLSGLLL